VKIVVLVKQVPCGPGGASFAADLTVDRARAGARLDQPDEYAIDQAHRIARRRRDVQITAVTMGPAGAVAALRTTLELGADEGVHVLDDDLHGSDALATARVLAAAVGRLGFDLVLCGCGSTDSGMSAVPAMVAERLGVAALCFADTLTVREGKVEIGRDDGAGMQAFVAALPAVVSVSARCGEPRPRTFAATADARQKVIHTWSLTDLGVERARVGRRGAATVVRRVIPRAGSRTRLVLADDPTVAAVRLADFLAAREFL
jgi:electron transfer flavoprotein beta subunit